jgi:hypothetical protein
MFGPLLPVVVARTVCLPADSVTTTGCADQAPQSPVVANGCVDAVPPSTATASGRLVVPPLA